MIWPLPTLPASCPSISYSDSELWPCGTAKASLLTVQVRAGKTVWVQSDTHKWLQTSVSSQQRWSICFCSGTSLFVSLKMQKQKSFCHWDAWKASFVMPSLSSTDWHYYYSCFINSSITPTSELAAFPMTFFIEWNCLPVCGFLLLGCMSFLHVPL